MNIFWLDSDVRKCAEAHNDRHCIKMIIEYAQILSTAHRILDGKMIIAKSPSGRSQKQWSLQGRQEYILYKATHINHPSAVWARETKANYMTLYSLFSSLLQEYEIRYGKTHKTSSLSIWLSVPPKNINDMKGRTDIPLCMPDEYKVKGDSVTSYRNYYRGGKAHIATWKNRNIPAWF